MVHKREQKPVKLQALCCAGALACVHHQNAVLRVPLTASGSLPQVTKSAGAGTVENSLDSWHLAGDEQMMCAEASVVVE